jgi:hypothetical protein
LATLAAELDRPARAYVTGAAAAALWGCVRPSLDVDLGLVLTARRKARRGVRPDGPSSQEPSSVDASWDVVERAVARACGATGIAASVAEDIDRWGMITLLDYRETSHRYRRFGRLEVRLLDPLHWSIGKLTRFLDADVHDVIAVFRARRVDARAAARLWGRAVRASPASTTQFTFRRHVEGFLRAHGRAIWGRAFDAEACVGHFQRAARMRSAVFTPPRRGSAPRRPGART